MLFFTYPQEFTAEFRQKLREELESVTGETCIVLDLGCTGVYETSENKNPLKKTSESTQLPQSPL